MSKSQRLELIKRSACRVFGREVTLETRGEPVTLFEICCRCGKWWRP